MTQEEADEIFARLRFATNLSEVAKNVDVVIECVPEVLDLKRQVSKELDQICPSHTILASNTSSLSITEIGSLTKRQGKVVGIHFSNAAVLLRFYEIIRGFETSEETLDTIKELASKLERNINMVKDAPGHRPDDYVYKSIKRQEWLLKTYVRLKTSIKSQTMVWDTVEVL
jgi:3-hydroxybutyryl-CoA dehydrogenase